eukprot:gene5741-6643_t
MSLNMASIVTSQGLFSTHPSSPTSTPSSLTPNSLDDSHLKKDDESEPTSPSNDTPKKAGRRKIKIEFIDDKSRRHITFSKRKAGIMKKAYELSTLTGTQVLLLVASETGHAQQVQFNEMLLGGGYTTGTGDLYDSDSIEKERRGLANKDQQQKAYPTMGGMSDHLMGYPASGYQSGHLISAMGGYYPTMNTSRNYSMGNPN